MNRLFRWVGSAALLFGVSATHAVAQSFYGSGSFTTESFPLSSGLAVFQVEHTGTDRFSVSLVGADGEIKQNLVNAAGVISDLRAIEISAAGEYRLTVDADGEWSVRLRHDAGTAATPSALETADIIDSEATVEGRADGDRAASERGWPWGWTARGLLGGAVAGPVGLGVAFALAGRSGADAPVPEAAATDEEYADAYQQSFAERIRARRKEAAVVGGLVGTGVFLYVLLQVIDLDGENEGSTGGQGPNPA